MKITRRLLVIEADQIARDGREEMDIDGDRLSMEDICHRAKWQMRQQLELHGEREAEIARCRDLLQLSIAARDDAIELLTDALYNYLIASGIWSTRASRRMNNSRAASVNLSHKFIMDNNTVTVSEYERGSSLRLNVTIEPNTATVIDGPVRYAQRSE
jgi:hypothetical protein